MMIPVSIIHFCLAVSLAAGSPSYKDNQQLNTEEPSIQQPPQSPEDSSVARGGGGGGRGGGGRGFEGGRGNFGHEHGEEFRGDARAYERGYDHGAWNNGAWGGAGGGYYEGGDVEIVPDDDSSNNNYYYYQQSPY